MNEKLQRTMHEARAVADLIGSARADELEYETLSWAGMLLTDLLGDIEAALEGAEAVR